MKGFSYEKINNEYDDRVCLWYWLCCCKRQHRHERTQHDGIRENRRFDP